MKDLFLYDIVFNSPKVTSSKMKKAEIIKVRDTIKYLLDTNVLFDAPSDRHIEVDIEGMITKDSLVAIIIFTPRYRDKSKKISDTLNRRILAKASIPIKTIEADIVKYVQWVLDTYSFHVMYDLHMREIVIEYKSGERPEVKVTT